MNLNQLLEILDRSQQGFVDIKADYGKITAYPDGNFHAATLDPTYHVDVEYDQSGNRVQISQTGFRFSTVGCLCATVCLGDNNVDERLIGIINQQFPCVEPGNLS